MNPTFSFYPSNPNQIFYLFFIFFPIVVITLKGGQTIRRDRAAKPSGLQALFGIHEKRRYFCTFGRCTPFIKLPTCYNSLGLEGNIIMSFMLFSTLSGLGCLQGIKMDQYDIMGSSVSMFWQVSFLFLLFFCELVNVSYYIYLSYAEH